MGDLESFRDSRRLNPSMRIWALLVIALVAFVALQSNAGNPPEYIEERVTSCWPCHVVWRTPLETFYTISVDEKIPLQQGQTTDINALVSHAWDTKEKWDLQQIQATLDLSNQTGVVFRGQSAPIHETLTGAFGNPLPPTEPVIGRVTQLIPGGASSASVTLHPSDASHDLRLQVVGPKGKSLLIDDAGAGQSEAIVYPTAQDVAALGYGNWTIEASLVPVDQEKGTVTPILEGTPFQAEILVDFDVTTQQIFIAPTDLTNLESTLFSWQLELQGEPVAGSIVISVEGTTYYKHRNQGDDIANVTKSLVIPSRVVDGQLLLEAPQDAVISLRSGSQNGPGLARASEAIGYASAFLLIASVWTGGMFGKSSRRQLNRVFGSARRRVAYHNLISYALTLVAIAHTVIFAVDIGALQADGFHWTLGLIWGGIALVAMILLGVTGAMQVPLIRRFNYPIWRWSHLGLAIAALAFTLIHLLLDGANFADLQETLRWQNPLDPNL